MRKFLILILAVILALGMMGGTFAFFVDTQTSNSNSFESGTLNLKISDDDEYPPEDGGVSYTWQMDNMIPGESDIGPWGVSLINTGTLKGDHVQISFTHEINDEPDVPSDTNPHSTPGEMARWLQILSMTYDGVTLVGAHPNTEHELVDANGNEFIDLEDVTLPANSAALDNLPAPPENSGGVYSFTMHLLFNSGATDDIQGDTLITTVSFTLNQHISQ